MQFIDTLLFLASFRFQNLMTNITRHAKAFQGACALISLSLASAQPALSQEIEWREIPGTQSSDPVFGDVSSFIGTNTIARSGDAINFDLLNSADNNYARIAVTVPEN